MLRWFHGNCIHVVPTSDFSDSQIRKIWCVLSLKWEIIYQGNYKLFTFFPICHVVYWYWLVPNGWYCHFQELRFGQLFCFFWSSSFPIAVWGHSLGWLGVFCVCKNKSENSEERLRKPHHWGSSLERGEYHTGYSILD